VLFIYESHSLKAFCFCREFHCRVLEMLSIQSVLLRDNGSTLGKGKRLALIVT
jgi:hypothetical protein